VNTKLFVVITLWSLVSQAVLADGYKLRLEGNKIVGQNNVDIDQAYLFGHSFDVTNNVDGTYESSHGSVDANDAGSGFNFLGDGRDDTFAYNIKAIWTLGDGGVVPTATGMHLTILKASNGDLLSEIDGQLASPVSFPIAASTTHETIWSVPQNTTTSIWGVLFTISGTSSITELPYEESEPFVAVQWTPQFEGDPDEAMATIYEAALGGDYDKDGGIDGRDFLLWQRTYGSNERLEADGSLNGVVDETDLFIWQQNYGRITQNPAMFAIPEPSSMVSILFGCLIFSIRRCRYLCWHKN
jgi:hypothetical protein